jgi:ABC-type transport system involved in cytochrome c biogenesis permease subunit
VPYVIGVNIGSEISQSAGILMSYWLYIHVTLAVASYALIGMSFLMGVWWLIYRVMRKGTTSPFAQMLDQCNLVSLQMAFWVLGIAIVFGAIWADVSWGRPWGWDPKETFALVTWICYLVIIHVRMISKGRRELWTAILSIIGFFVMLFNWIGVNYFLVGLHSYA